MKRLLLAVFILATFLCGLSASAYQNPGKPTGFVNDFAGIFTLDEKVALEVKLSAFEKETGNEISVVTLKDLGGDTGANFATKLIEDWGIGKKGANNGVLFLIALAEHDVRIDVGYGLEPTVTDGAASAILRTVVLPAFKEGKFFDGIQAGTDKVMGIIKGDPEAMKFASSTSPAISSVNWPEIIIFVVFLAIVLSTRRGRRMLPFLLWSGIGRGGFGGGRSGGFGGFGGGRSGGGGAGGKW